MKEGKSIEMLESPSKSYEGMHGYYAQTMEINKPIDTKDDRDDISLRFIEQENFTQTQEFKDFWIKYKMRDFMERKRKILEGVDESQHAS